MPDMNQAEYQEIDPLKFRDPDFTAKGEQRAVVALTHLRTLWFNTGSLCNIACRNCYMESTPTNDKLTYLTLAEMVDYLDEMAREDMDVEEIAFTGGEPFMNPDLPQMMDQALQRGYRVLVLTNAMKPLHHKRTELLALKDRHGDKLAVRVSIDHFTSEKHEHVRGAGTWHPMLEGLKWLAEKDFNLAVAGRTCWDESDEEARAGYAALFAHEDIKINATDQAALVLFPEMDPGRDVPEITVHCWDILGVAPETIMCATSRMVIKRKEATQTAVVPCTLLPYDAQFELGHDLLNAAKSVKLNHPHCATFCVLGGSSCTIA
ncbi:MAG: radical SAM protein [Rhodospirillaceae bacterium]|jgi:pyruvate-formate lyase-activating enzyme|nr:radical SAM protein [Rhodospirillales bacterium]MBT3905527.1 radical SAM protein [Rhodospirillaceae bacterium]MBT4703677.1 radical SAM protein [Rhodospirillaceae bacterium]MBT5035939.1 radical SAM protein [Rhodospirillaceae bacterium]MBT6220285.1 radical SAM protein [Rhodospirillaceae bacterium]